MAKSITVGKRENEKRDSLNEKKNKRKRIARSYPAKAASMI